MSIGIYAFLRIIFRVLACPLGRALSDTLPTLHRTAAGMISPAWALLYRVQTGAARPASGRVCVGAWRGLPCIWHACRAACAVQSVRARWGAGVPPAGYIAAAQPHPVSPVTTEKIKKTKKITLPPIANLKNSAKKQKDHYKGSVFCAILALQALKGRNLQWLKVK